MTFDGPAAVLGAGAWGTALALHLARRGREVRLWARRVELADALARERVNADYLPGAELPPAVRPLAEVDRALRGAALVVVAVPTPFAGAVLGASAGHVAPDAAVVLAMKGIEEETLDLPTEIAGRVLGPSVPLGVLSGPSFAGEVVLGRPTAVVLASRGRELALALQRALSGANLRVYSSVDPTGVQLAGSLKNVIAIAAGLAAGLGMGPNAIAALVTRGLAEMARLGVACGARAETFSGLAGLGDLVLTCTGSASRNRRVGERLGRGESLSAIVADRSFAEGVRTTRSARALAARHAVEMPIVEEVYRILYEGGAPHAALARLMGRPLTSEGGLDERR